MLKVLQIEPKKVEVVQVARRAKGKSFETHLEHDPTVPDRTTTAS